MQNDNCKIYIKCRKFQYEKPYHSLDAQNKDKSQYERPAFEDLSHLHCLKHHYHHAISILNILIIQKKGKGNNHNPEQFKYNYKFFYKEWKAHNSYISNPKSIPRRWMKTCHANCICRSIIKPHLSPMKLTKCN